MTLLCVPAGCALAEPRVVPQTVTIPRMPLSPSTFHYFIPERAAHSLTIRFKIELASRSGPGARSRSMIFAASGDKSQ